MKWRRLRQNEIDHEFVWLAVSIASILIAAAWIKFHLPLPSCVFHRFTGVACPGCGATRCFRAVIGGHYKTAFLLNPLMFCALAVAALFDLYACVVLFFRLPRARITPVSQASATAFRSMAVTSIVVNWLYLIYQGR